VILWRLIQASGEINLQNPARARIAAAQRARWAKLKKAKAEKEKK
jgi:hypothetical protein